MFCYNNVLIPQLVQKCQCHLIRKRRANDEERIVNIAADDVQESI